MYAPLQNIHIQARHCPAHRFMQPLKGDCRAPKVRCRRHFAQLDSWLVQVLSSRSNERVDLQTFQVQQELSERNLIWKGRAFGQRMQTTWM